MSLFTFTVLVCILSVSFVVINIARSLSVLFFLKNSFIYLFCHVGSTFGILVPSLPGSKLGPFAWKCGVLTPGLPGKSCQFSSFCVCVIYLFCPCWVFVAMCAFLYLWWTGAAVQSPCKGFSCCGARTLGCTGFRSFCTGLWSTDSTAVVHGLVILGQVGSFWTIDGTCVSCIGRWILYHWATREI